MPLRHVLLTLVVVVVWGINFVVIDAGLEGVPPLLFLAARFLLVAVPALFFVRPPDLPIRTVVTIGGFLSLGQFAFLYLALHLGLPPGLASLLVQTQILFTVGVAALVLKERPTPVQLIGLVVGVAGLAVVILGQGAETPWLPIVVALGAALSWSVGNVLARRAKASSGLSLVVWSALVVPLPALALSLLVDGPEAVGAALPVLVQPVALLSTLYTAVFASLLGYGIWNTLLVRHEAARVVPFALLVPIVGMAAAWVVQGEEPLPAEWIGGAVMLAGLAVSTVRFGRRGDARVSTLLDGPAVSAAGAPETGSIPRIRER